MSKIKVLSYFESRKIDSINRGELDYTGTRLRRELTAEEQIICDMYFDDYVEKYWNIDLEKVYLELFNSKEYIDYRQFGSLERNVINKLKNMNIDGTIDIMQNYKKDINSILFDRLYIKLFNILESMNSNIDFDDLSEEIYCILDDFIVDAAKFPIYNFTI